MEKGEILNVVFLCIINILFMLAGIFLNSVVIISFWRSRQLRKQLCYFMILVLSCFDLAVVSINHPFLITSAIYYCLDEISKKREYIRGSISIILCGLSMTALLTLNVERFLALTCPYFHQRSVTKTKFVCFQAFMTILIVGVSSLAYLDTPGEIAVHVIIAFYMSLLSFLFVYGNCKMFTIAKSKRGDEKVAPNFASSVNNIRKIRAINLKSISTCSLAVGCFFVCFFPYIIFSAFRFTGAAQFGRQVLLYNIWTSTFVSINSTLNCVIFFWKNSILRREGMKIINAFRAHVVN